MRLKLKNAQKLLKKSLNSSERFLPGSQLVVVVKMGIFKKKGADFQKNHQGQADFQNKSPVDDRI